MLLGVADSRVLSWAALMMPLTRPIKTVSGISSPYFPSIPLVHMLSHVHPCFSCIFLFTPSESFLACVLYTGFDLVYFVFGFPAFDKSLFAFLGCRLGSRRFHPRRWAYWTTTCIL
ncbi:uncharacterized protein BO80DRAFT_252432 [Aspergillus ibericus CBS 121593]|uniref:Uncharacterized protein n=1 Tax=Aspergillus ibericus CBS 121593 TaxID=1448316 RepID=A0A395HAL7_9EURO|nr:hypothetical protein BO80DRAFT_252432 [Aspergillus ibericus CBS 121593]RAL03968.1 hypothetical protein BO80DRAFT_252432 [Aspergillus ibericus CBS 121593]